VSNTHSNQKQEEAWENIFQEKKYCLLNPDPWVIERLKEFRAVDKGIYIDVGCGLGRHLEPLFMEYKSCVGLDISRTAAETTRGRTNPSISIIRGSMTNLPFSNGAANVILTWRCIYLLKIDQIEQAISEIYRVLRPGGYLLCSIRSTTNTLYYVGREKGKQIEPGTFRYPVEEFQGATYHFFTEDEIRQRFHKFEIDDLHCRELEHTSFTVNRSEYKNNFWIFSARKR